MPRTNPKNKKQQPQRKNRQVRQSNTRVSRAKNAPGEDYGKQLASVVSRGYGATLAMYPSTKAFARVYLDPFSTRSARIPDFPVYPSQLLRLEQEFTVSCSAGSEVAWACFSPINMVCQDLSYGWRTNGSAISPPEFQTALNPAVTPVTAASPYTTGYFNSAALTGRGVRIVAWGFQIQNISAELNMAGKYYANQVSPRLSGTLIGTDEETMSQFPTYKEKAAAVRSNFYYHRMITERADLRYNQYKLGTGWIYADDQSSSSEQSVYLGVLVRAPGLVAGESFTVKCVGHFEIIGLTRNTPGLGMTTSDTKGLETVVQKGHDMRFSAPTSVDHISGKTPEQQDSFLNKLGHVATSILPIPGIAKNLLDSALDKFM